MNFHENINDQSCIKPDEEWTTESQDSAEEEELMLAVQ